MTKPQDDGEAVAPCTCGQSGHGNAHDPDCPRSDYKPIKSERQEAMATRDDGGYWDNSDRHHPVRDDGKAVAFNIDEIMVEAERRHHEWNRPGVTGQAVRPEQAIEYWYALVSHEKAVSTLTRQLAEAQQRSDYQYLKTTMQHEIETLKLKLAEAQAERDRMRPSVIAALSPTPPAPVVTEEMAIITGCNAWFEARLRRGLDTELRKCSYPSCTCTQTPTAIKAALSRQLAEAQGVIERQRKGLEAAEQWLSGWASAEPYISAIRAAISPPQEQHPAALQTSEKP